MRKLIKIAATFVILFSGVSAWGQEINQKFGKVSEFELNMKTCEIDTSADAVVLFDKGYTYFNYDEMTKDFKLNFERNLRIKILKKSGIENATFKIALYKDGTNKENLQNIKGVTYNMENGKIAKLKLEKKDIYTEEESEKIENVNFSFPGVAEGSVIELTYVIQSDFYYNFQNWQIQKKIPVVYSEYYTVIPEYFKYQLHVTGYENVKIDKVVDQKPEDFTIGDKSPNHPGSTRGHFSYNIHSLSESVKWTATKIPAFKTEAYMTSERNFMTEIVYELESIQFPNQLIHFYTDSWKKIDERLLESEHFGKQLNPTNKVKDLTNEAIGDAQTPEDKMNRIYNYLTQNYIWTKIRTKYVDENLSKVIKEKKGNSADINILLLSMLRAAGIKVVPVVLSTRENGYLNTAYPTIANFDYVVVQANINGKSILLDATEKYLPAGYLPFHCLNGKGRIVDAANGSEIEIVPAGDRNMSEFQTLTIQPNGDI